MPPVKKKLAVKAAAKKKAAPKKKAPAKPMTAAQKRRSEAAKRGAVGRRRTAPRGPRLTAAHQGARDALIMVRVSQGWTWDEAAAEAGISVSAASRAVKKRREAAPLRLNMDPARVIETVFEGFQNSIADQERIAAAALEANNLAAAVGAKKGADAAREKIIALLQSTGRLPQELGALRHLIDLRAIAVKMLDTVDGFAAALAAVEISEESRVLIDNEVQKVRTTFNELIGLKEDPEPDQLAA